MSRVTDHTGKTYGLLTVIERAENQGRKSTWRVVCECGNTSVVQASSLVSGATKSCGCERRRIVTEAKTTHGHSRGGAISPTYKTWQSMKTRCSNKNATYYSYYGGRGITYDPKWNSFELFLEDMGEKPAGTSIDRIDNDGNYCKENCRWATAVEQANNKRPRAPKPALA